MAYYVLVHGAFVDGWYWGETARLLDAEGHEVRIAELPSTGTDPGGLGGLSDDVAEVRRLVAAAGEPVVLVGHSYGGAVITPLAADPGVALSVYVGAAWPRRGQSPLDMEGGLPDWMVLNDDGTAVRVTGDVARAADALCADLDPARVPEWHAHLMYSGMSGATLPVTAPDPTHPTAYVVLEKDRAIPTALQEVLAERADRVERLATSHTPQLVDPKGLAAILDRIAR
jgi:pimeloyl-ACP methyl ester carboxylesterase